MENYIICNCKQVSYTDIEHALENHNKMEDVMDVLILAMARHMLVTHTSVEGTLLQIIGICLLFLVRCVIRKFSNTEKKDEWDEDCDDCR